MASHDVNPGYSGGGDDENHDTHPQLHPPNHPVVPVEVKHSLESSS